jgi:hypothetical protein
MMVHVMAATKHVTIAYLQAVAGVNDADRARRWPDRLTPMIHQRTSFDCHFRREIVALNLEKSGAWAHNAW